LENLWENGGGLVDISNKSIMGIGRVACCVSLDFKLTQKVKNKLIINIWIRAEFWFWYNF
jgi:hypothetical protein